MIYGIILASGSGSRFGYELPKQFVKIAGKTVIEHTITVFEQSKYIDRIIVVITPEYRVLFENILLKNHFKKIYKVLNGGATRKESSSIAISAIPENDADVMIHDCARPFLSQNIITACYEALKTYDAIDVAIPSADTLIEIDDNKYIKNIPNRKYLQRGQTPQCFKLTLIRKAHELSKNDESFTDDCGIVVKHNLAKVYVVNGENKNFKITMPEDIFLADKLFQINSVSGSTPETYGTLKDKVLVVFGGSSGIGKFLVELGKKYGAKTFAFSRSNGTDISNYNNIAKNLTQVEREAGHIDYVVNTAGVLNIGKLLDKDLAEIKNEIMVNYIGAIYVCKAAIPYLSKTNGKILLFTSSSYTRGRALYSTYSSTKAAIVNLVQALAEELYSDGIKINCINPERTATSMRFNAFGKEPENSLLSPQIVANVCANILLSNITGQIIDVRRNDIKI